MTTFRRVVTTLSLFVLSVAAQHAHDSSPSSSSSSESTTSVMMVPYLHFTPGDAVWFKEWVPRSRGAITGACVGLFLLAILERFLSGMKGVMESWWKMKTMAILQRQLKRTSTTTVNRPSSPEPSGCCNDLEKEPGSNATSVPVVSAPRIRNLPPFIPSHELVRGALMMLQAAVGYALMLVVMTYNASFIISILIGAFAGEVMFGRFGSISIHG